MKHIGGPLVAVDIEFIKRKCGRQTENTVQGSHNTLVLLSSVAET